jgi:heme/copper-type cytochrome/quinol oxidase subunit 1
LRAQLARPHNSPLGAQTYNELFAMHRAQDRDDLLAVPCPRPSSTSRSRSHIGARDVAFPRLNTLSYGLPRGRPPPQCRLALRLGPGAGWLGYANLTSAQFSPGAGLDFWILAIQVLA